MLNTVLLQGRVPFEVNYFEGDDSKKSFAAFTLAVSTGIKNEETGYYNEEMYRCTASGAWADMLKKNWTNKMTVDIQGKLVMGKDYEKNGEIIKGQPEIRVTSIHDYNNLDVTILKGKIPRFENAISYKAGEGDKKSFARIKLSVSTGIKNSETGYYNERIVTAKAFGGTADFINKYYNSGDLILVDGKYAEAAEFTNDQGELVKPQPELIINNVHGLPKRSEETAEEKTSSAPKLGGGKLGGNKLGGSKLGGNKLGGNKLGGSKLGAGKAPALSLGFKK